MPVNDPWLPAGTVPLQRDPTPIKVYRYTPGEDGSGTSFELENVALLKLRAAVGPNPDVALFRYKFGTTLDGAPNSVEEALSTTFTGPRVVELGDRLLVRAIQPDDTEEVIFYGQPLTWTMRLGPGEEMVIIQAHGMSRTLSFNPIAGALMRKANAPDTVDDVETSLIAQFNPRGIPNATPSGADAGTDPQKYATFLDPTVIRNPDRRRKWTLPMAAKHLCYYNNPTQAEVRNPTSDTLDTLVAKEPTSGLFDPNNPATYTVKDLIPADIPMTGKDWPAVLYALIRREGFGMYYWTTTSVIDGDPRTELRIYANQERTPKQLMIQAAGEALDPARSNTRSADISRSIEDLANRWTVEGAIMEAEVTVILQAGFPMASVDGSSSAFIAQYDRTGIAYLTTTHDTYRLYVFDETGEGHYAPGTSTKLTNIPSLDDVLGEGYYTVRRRPGRPNLISCDPNRKPLRARLEISHDYTGAAPMVYDKTDTAHWQEVEGGYELLKDRLGIRITNGNPNEWKIGKSKAGGAPYPLGIVRGVEHQATTGPKNFTLRLTTVIRSDEVLSQTAERRDSSPEAETITRIVDARDRLKKTVISASSIMNDTADEIEAADPAKDYTALVRDDTDAARSEAEAHRYAMDNGVMAGPVLIPRFTRYYELGDRIDRIEGREIPLRTNVGGDEGDGAIYPTVIAIEWDFDRKQTTMLQLSDASTERRAYRAATRRKEKPG